jgi:hypothetical protein
MLHFVFPASPLDQRSIEPDFERQRRALADAGFSTSLVFDAMFDVGAPLVGVPAESTVVYRSWMVDPLQYERFAAAVVAAGAGLLTSAAEYRRTHYLPEWYPLLRDLTPETVFLPTDADLERELHRLGWGEFFIKDYVKSLKTAPGPIVRHPAEAKPLVEAMVRYRGTIEGGLCVRRVERFVAGSERRFFVIDRQPADADGSNVPEIIRAVAGRIDSRFYSVDVAQNEQGAWRVVEIGDGQVSDLVGWSENAFVKLWGSSVDVEI